MELSEPPFAHEVYEAGRSLISGLDTSSISEIPTLKE